MEFTNKPLDWSNPGQEPSEELVAKGFEGGYKPPASLFNNKWTRDALVQKELQEKLASHAHDGKNGERINYKDIVGTPPSSGKQFYGVMAADGWGDEAPYSQTIMLPDAEITADTIGELFPVFTLSDSEKCIEERAYWSLIYGGETIDGGVKIYCMQEKPEIDLNFMVEV